MGAECLHDIKPEGWVLVYMRHGVSRVGRVPNLDHGWHLHARCLLVNDGMATPKQRMKRKPKIKRRVWMGWVATKIRYSNADPSWWLMNQFSLVEWGRFTHRAKITVEWEQ